MFHDIFSYIVFMCFLSSPKFQPYLNWISAKFYSSPAATSKFAATSRIVLSIIHLVGSASYPWISATISFTSTENPVSNLACCGQEIIGILKNGLFAKYDL